MAIVGYKISDGKSITITAGGSYSAGTWYYVSGFVGLCFKDAVSGDEVAFNIEEAEYKTDQIDTADTLAVGTIIYWDSGNSRFTSEGATGQIECGKITKAKDSNNIIYFKLHSHGAIVPA